MDSRRLCKRCIGNVVSFNCSNTVPFLSSFKTALLLILFVIFVLHTRRKGSVVGVFLVRNLTHLDWVRRDKLFKFICMNNGKALAQNRSNIWNLSFCNGNRTLNHLVRKQLLNHLAQLACCIHWNFRCPTCFEQRVPWHSDNYRAWIFKNVCDNVNVTSQGSCTKENTVKN